MDKYSLAIDGLDIELTPADVEQLDITTTGQLHHIISDGNSYSCKVLSITGKSIQLQINNNNYTVQISDAVDQVVEQMGLNKVTAPILTSVKAPMPGLILDILVKPGQSFEEGDALLILEAMKMENVLKATGSGTVKDILLEKGATVEKNQVIIEME